MSLSLYQKTIVLSLISSACLSHGKLAQGLRNGSVLKPYNSKLALPQTGLSSGSDSEKNATAVLQLPKPKSKRGQLYEEPYRPPVPKAKKVHSRLKKKPKHRVYVDGAPVTETPGSDGGVGAPTAETPASDGAAAETPASDGGVAPGVTHIHVHSVTDCSTGGTLMKDVKLTWNYNGQENPTYIPLGGTVQVKCTGTLTEDVESATMSSVSNLGSFTGLPVTEDLCGVVEGNFLLGGNYKTTGLACDGEKVQQKGELPFYVQNKRL